MNKKIIGLITTIAIISIIIGSTAVMAKEDNGKPMWERLFSVFVTNTDPIPVSVDGSVELEDNEMVVSEYTGSTIPITGTVELAEGTTVSLDSLTDVSIKVDTYFQVVFYEVELAPGTATEIMQFNIDGYKTIHIWCIIGETGSPKVIINFIYPEVDLFRRVGEYDTTTFETLSVTAPEISFHFGNTHYEETATATVIFYAQAI